MASLVTDDLPGVLQSLLQLYGDGPLDLTRAADTVNTLLADPNIRMGHMADGYAGVRGTQVAIKEAQTTKDDAVNKVVAESRTGTIDGRNKLTDQMSEFQSRVQAIATVGDTRFSGSALLDAARTAISKATTQVDADNAAVEQRAAQIVPPTIAPQRFSRAARTRRRSRRTGIGQARVRLPSDKSAGGRAVQIANSSVGTPYAWGGGGAQGPSGGGFDCSGLTQYAVAQASHGGVILPRTTYGQIHSGYRVPVQDVQPGDLVFPAGSFSMRGPEHVQLAAGNGMVIEAPHSGSTVRWSRMPANAVVVRVL